MEERSENLNSDDGAENWWFGRKGWLLSSCLATRRSEIRYAVAILYGYGYCRSVETVKLTGSTEALILAIK
jgi:hypothetical protein